MAGGVVIIPVVIGDTTRNVEYWSTDGTFTGELTPMVSGNPTGPTSDVTTQAALPSGVTPVTGTFVATGQSANFAPQPGRDINVLLVGAALVGVSIRLERNFNDGNGWNPLTINGTPWAVYTTAVNEDAWTEYEDVAGAIPIYRLNCTAYGSSTAGVAYRISH